MSVLDHWHPVLLARELGHKPFGVRVAGHEIALFRAQQSIAAIHDVCPHRRMRLSVGKVLGDCLQCGYHGWTFDAEGRGESPGTPKLCTQTDSYEVREAHGLIWLRARGSQTSFPVFDRSDEGYVPMVALCHDIGAPLELVLDNFNELEHTPTTHSVVGFPLERMHEVESEFEAADDMVRIRYRGPCRKYPWLFRTFLRLSSDPVFHVDGATRYSPVFTYGDYRWTDSGTGKQSWVRVRNVHLMTPIDDDHTRVFTLSYMRLDNTALNWMLRFVRPFMRRSYQREVDEDQRTVEGLADKSVSLDGLKLSRFDRVLGLNRERIDRIYRRQQRLHVARVAGTVTPPAGDAPTARGRSG